MPFYKLLNVSIKNDEINNIWIKVMDIYCDSW